MATSSVKTVTVQISTGGEVPYDDTVSGGILSTFSDNVFGAWILTKADGRYESDLLDYSFSDNGKKLALRLKPEVSFHNGRAMSAKDIEFSLLRGFWVNPPFFAGFLKCIPGISENLKSPQSGSVTGIRVIDHKTIELNFTRPCPEILHSLSLPFFSPHPMEEMQPDHIRFKNLPVGAGPYKVMREDHEKGIYHLERIRGEGPIRLRLLTRDGAKLAQVIYGSVPVPNGYSRTTAVRPIATLTLFSSNSHPLFSDPEIRSLFYTIFDRSRLITHDSYQPSANLSTFGNLAMPSFLEVKQARERLKFLLRKKFPHGLVLDIPVNARTFSPEFKEIATQLQTQLRTVDIKAQFFSRPNKFLDGEDAAKSPFWLWWLVIDPLAPSVMLASFHPESAYRFHRVADPQAGRLFAAVQKAADFNTRQQAERALDVWLSSQGYGIPLLRTKNTFSFDSKFVQTLGIQSHFLSIDFTQIKSEPCEHLLAR